MSDPKNDQSMTSQGNEIKYVKNQCKIMEMNGWNVSVPLAYNKKLPSHVAMPTSILTINKASKFNPNYTK